jgi:hypothetical protein
MTAPRATTGRGDVIPDGWVLCTDRECWKWQHAHPAPLASAPVRAEEPTLLVAINRACEIIEVADARNLANDGPAGGFPPQMTLKEWRTLYVTLDRARR